MTQDQEKDLAQMERDILAAGIAESEKAIFKQELYIANENWYHTSTRLRKAIDQCIAIIEGTKHDG